MSKSIQLKNKDNENMYPHPYYPVGSIYLSVENINPSKWFGGSWEQIAKGRTLVGVDTSQVEFNTVKKTGGERVHKLTVNEMPKHVHKGLTFWNKPISLDSGTIAGYNLAYGNNIISGREDNIYTTNSGGDQPHNNLQPYFTCYIWCRTA